MGLGVSLPFSNLHVDFVRVHIRMLGIWGVGVLGVGNKFNIFTTLSGGLGDLRG